MDSTIASTILEQLQVPGWKNLYLLGSYGRRVTFHAQQTRAFNLVEALCTLQNVNRVLVVGAGLAGVTAAAALLLRRKDVHLIDAQTQELAIQRGNHERYIHPNLFDWPAEHAHFPSTVLPALNWEAGMLDRVIATIVAEWTKICGTHGHRLRFERGTRLLLKQGTLKKVRRMAGTSEVDHEEEINSGDYSAIILAIGFGSDERMNAAGSRSYWRNNGLHQEILSTGEKRRVLVSGTGDGGLIEVQRLTLKSFDHQIFTEALVRSKLIPWAILHRLREIEKELIKRNKPVQFLNREYRRLNIPTGLQEFFESQTRNDTDVVLVSRSRYPLSPNASALNRFVVHVLIKMGRVRYLSGETGELQFISRKSPYAVEILRESRPALMEVFQEVVFRHGPDRDERVRALFGEVTEKEISDKWSTLRADPTIVRAWTGYPQPSRSRAVSVRHADWLVMDPRSLEAAIGRLLVCAGVEDFEYHPVIAHERQVDFAFRHAGSRYLLEVKALREPLRQRHLDALPQPGPGETLIIFSRSNFDGNIALPHGCITWTMDDVLGLQGKTKSLRGLLRKPSG